LYATLVVVAYLGIILMSLVGPLYLWSLIVLLSIPLAVRLLVQMMKQVPADADARTAQLDTAFGLLLVISLILEGAF
jgi:1,4-dihydroxy-2-naphthoate octaprenyltransferase